MMNKVSIGSDDKTLCIWVSEQIQKQIKEGFSNGKFFGDFSKGIL